MKKLVPIFISITLLLTSMISAYYYNPASIGAFFDTLGGENLGLLIAFSVSFAFITIALNRTNMFRENHSASTIISLMLSLGITYGIYKQGINFDIASLLYNFGISETALDVLVFFGVLGLIVLLIAKFKSSALLIIGGFILALTFAGVIQDPGMLLIIGGGLVIVWLLIKWRGIRKESASRKFDVNFRDRTKRK